MKGVEGVRRQGFRRVRLVDAGAEEEAAGGEVDGEGRGEDGGVSPDTFVSCCRLKATAVLPRVGGGACAYPPGVFGLLITFDWRASLLKWGR